MNEQPRFVDLIDFCIEAERDPDISGKGEEVFRRLLIAYFFREETEESKGFTLFLEKLDLPGFLGNYSSMFDVDLDELKKSIDGETTNDSLCGKIMLSVQYLKAFYPHHPPSFSQLPADVKPELLTNIKKMNADIFQAFEKLKKDEAVDRCRKIITLIAMILKRIHVKTEFPLNKLTRKAEDIIREIYEDCDDVFRATPKQLAELRDDTRLKTLIKTFFSIRKFQEISEIATLFKEEFERLKNRTVRALQ
jgi:hypothetical protein